MLLGDGRVNADCGRQNLFDKLDRCVHYSPFSGEDAAKLMTCPNESNPRTFYLGYNQKKKISLVSSLLNVYPPIIKSVLSSVAVNILP